MSFGPKPRDAADRFWSKVDKSPEGCWLWNGSIDPYGYGRIGVGSEVDKTAKVVKVHRFSWELAHGPIPPGEHYGTTCVLHRCDVPACVNPAHLFLGTQTDNMRDMRKKKRGNIGEKNGRSRLTVTAVKTIRKSYANGIQREVIAEQFSIAPKYISDIVNRKRWRHVE